MQQWAVERTSRRRRIRLSCAVVLLSLCGALGAAPTEPVVTPAERTEAMKLAYDYRKARTDEERSELVAKAAGSTAMAKERVLEQVHVLIGRDRERYQTMMLRATQMAAAKMKSGADANDLNQQREAIDKVIAAPTKEAVHDTADPALAKLRTALVPATSDILAADQRIAEVRQSLEVYAEQAAKLGDAPVERTLSNLDQAVIIAALGTAQDRAAVAANTKLYDELDPEEVAGFLELDLIRVLLKRPVQVIDPKLVGAARGHSREMVEKGYFSHESPTAGLVSPWDRAKRAGTSANAENIAAGTNSGVGAIQMWWHSPGHLTNMMANHRRAGLGKSSQTWTQMFGD
ncbi:MAG: hypothetical protein GC162_14845 [Planctomycetes bacterium]|nr:hypothetical protein [Planctomycetota bacterium]